MEKRAADLRKIAFLKSMGKYIKQDNIHQELLVFSSLKDVVIWIDFDSKEIRILSEEMAIPSTKEKQKILKARAKMITK